MSACDRCWDSAYLRHRMDPHKSQAEHYQDILAEFHRPPDSPAAALLGDQENQR